MPTFAQRALTFYARLPALTGLPRGVQVMNPYAEPEVLRLVEQFLQRFYSDQRERVFIFGINPGRFGAGVTGVTFTDPVALERDCGIPNVLEKRRELSSEFLYEVIEAWGGAAVFYRAFFLTAVSPLGFTRQGRNYNFYDDLTLLARVRPFLATTLRHQVACGARRDVALLLGTGKNQQIFRELNQQLRLFDRVIPLEHPRFIMQYRRRQLRAFVRKYARTLTQAFGVTAPRPVPA